MRKRCQLINVDVDVDVDADESFRQLVEDGITTRMARGFSVLLHVFAREQCILCSGLRHKSYLTLLYVTPSCYTLELSRTALLGCPLAASLPRVFARLLVGHYHHHDLALKVFALKSKFTLFVYKIHLGNQIDRAGYTLLTDSHEIIFCLGQRGQKHEKPYPVQR